MPPKNTSSCPRLGFHQHPGGGKRGDEEAGGEEEAMASLFIEPGTQTYRENCLLSPRPLLTCLKILDLSTPLDL